MAIDRVFILLIGDLDLRHQALWHQMLLNACTVHAINAYLAQLVKAFHFVQMGVGSTCVKMVLWECFAFISKSVR